MAKVHELLGQETEKRIEAEEKANANFQAFKGALELIIRIQLGEVEPDSVRIFIGPDSANWTLEKKEDIEIQDNPNSEKIR
jgi:hypothetical protein